MAPDVGNREVNIWLGLRISSSFADVFVGIVNGPYLSSRAPFDRGSLAIFWHFAFIESMNAHQSRSKATALFDVRRGITHGIG